MRVTLAVLIALVWCLLSMAVAFGLGPLLHKAAVLADARDAVGAGRNPAGPSSRLAA